ncbi:unnamed protein product, partial [Heterobilharzia americana]
MNHESQLLDNFNQAHPTVNFTMECENEDRFNFLDLSIRRRCNGTVEKTIHRKETQICQYLHYNRLYPVIYKRGLVRTIFSRMKMLCSKDKQEEFAITEKALIKNGYSKKIIMKHGKELIERSKHPTVGKKAVFLHLTFKGDEASERIDKRIKAVLRRSFPA